MDDRKKKKWSQQNPRSTILSFSDPDEQFHRQTFRIKTRAVCTDFEGRSRGKFSSEGFLYNNSASGYTATYSPDQNIIQLSLI